MSAGFGVGLSADGAAGLAVRVLIVLVTAVAMEGVAGLVHRHWMHGPGWCWHRSHHVTGDRPGWERNDLHALVFGAIATALFFLGHGPWWPLYWVGAGMTLYGLGYLMLHDGLVHRRGPLRGTWLGTPRRGYLARLVQAHRLHHAVRERDGAVSFGFLYAPPAAALAAALRERRCGRADAAAPRARTARRRQGRVGVALAAAVVATWLATQAVALFAIDLAAPGAAWAAPLPVAFVCWLDVGLFIVAHDALHGSLVPTHRALNRAIGRLCLWLYAGFALDRLAAGHFGHHRHPGTDDDPDFHPEGRRLWPWYLRFMRRYMGWREVAGLAVCFVLLTLVLRAPLANVMLFWALPAILSSLQLFVFGTWLPHRRGDEPFADDHRARSSRWGWAASLLSCFHFGYHHAHHLRPDTPWWRLPAVHRRLQAARLTRAAGSTAGRAATAPMPDRSRPRG